MIAAMILAFTLLGAQATYTDAAGGQWCVTVSSVAPGVADQPHAWATVNADPRRVVHVPVALLVQGCR